LDNCLEIDAIMGDISFFMGLLITSNIQWERKRLFGATGINRINNPCSSFILLNP
jgi:hypothetical protein